MFDSKTPTPDQFLLQASQLVEDVAFDLASSTSVDLIARLIVISAELEEIAGKAAARQRPKAIPMRRYSDA